MVITLEARRMARFTGSGSSAAPSPSAVCRWRASSARIASTTARVRSSSGGSASRWPREVLLDLPFGFGEESEIPAVAEQAGGGADGERARIPQRVEQAEPSIQLADALGAPGQVVLFLARCAIERLPRGRIARRERLPLIERLRANFADVVDAHQRRGVRTLFLADRIFGHALRRRGRLACATPATARSARSNSAIRRSMRATIKENGRPKAPVSTAVLLRLEAMNHVDEEDAHVRTRQRRVRHRLPGDSRATAGCVGDSRSR